MACIYRVVIVWIDKCIRQNLRFIANDIRYTTVVPYNLCTRYVNREHVLEIHKCLPSSTLRALCNVYVYTLCVMLLCIINSTPDSCTRWMTVRANRLSVVRRLTMTSNATFIVHAVIAIAKLIRLRQFVSLSLSPLCFATRFRCETLKRLYRSKTVWREERKEQETRMISQETFGWLRATERSKRRKRVELSNGIFMNPDPSKADFLFSLLFFFFFTVTSSALLITYWNWMGKKVAKKNGDSMESE